MIFFTPLIQDCDESDMKFSNDTVDGLGWLPLTCLMIYMVTFAIGTRHPHLKAHLKQSSYVPYLLD